VNPSPQPLVVRLPSASPQDKSLTILSLCFDFAQHPEFIEGSKDGIFNLARRRGHRGRGQNSLSVIQIKIITDMIESITTRREYLTSRQVTSVEKGDLVKRNLNFSPFRVIATFCHPFKIRRKIKMKKRIRIAILSPS